MDRVFIIIACLAIGAVGSYFVFTNNTESFSQVIISTPNLVNKQTTIEVYSGNTIVVVKKRLGGNNAVAMLQSTSKTLIGVDFTDFDWGKLAGIGTELAEEHLSGSKTVTIKGTMPPLEVLEHFEVSGSEKREILSLVTFFKEEKLWPFANAKRTEIQNCIQDSILYQQEFLDNAMTTVISLLSAAMPRRQDGTSIVEFDLQFENEAVFKKRVEEQSQKTPKECSDTIYYYEG